jgi:hypothetical protein
MLSGLNHQVTLYAATVMLILFFGMGAGFSAENSSESLFVLVSQLPFHPTGQPNISSRTDRLRQAQHCVQARQACGAGYYPCCPGLRCRSADEFSQSFCR